MSSQRFFAACAKSLEGLVRAELEQMGAQDIRETVAGVHFAGGLELAYRMCLWSRVASRIVLRLKEFPLENENDLYQAVYEIDWSAHMDERGTLAVDAHGRHPFITHTQFAAQRVKDAVVDQCRNKFNTRPDVNLEEPDLRISLVLDKESAIIGIDLSGSPLHRRGYRVQQGEAPIKENLASAMLIRSRWLDIYAAGGGLLDPMCGSGTLLIEGALMAADVAPGLAREYFGFLGWKQHQVALWKKLRDEAQTRADIGMKNLRPVFVGFDRDGIAIHRATANAQRAGIACLITLEKHDVEHLLWPGQRPEKGLLITNPPYGERLGQQRELLDLYRALGDALKKNFPGWTAAVITPELELGLAIGMKAHKKYKLFNGAIECQLLIFEVLTQRPEPRIQVAIEADPHLQALANRLQKNFKHLKKWREREGVSCYRLYDADIPEYAAAIDVYGSAEGDLFHLQEYQAPQSIPPEVAAKRLRDLVRVCGAEFSVPANRLAVKSRQIAKGGSKYGRMDERGEFVVVEENELKFEINLFDYLDTGLFLDHRDVRARIQSLVRNKRFLNLFSYTGAATVYAASGGARETVSVDLSATYLDWADRNLNHNAFSGAEHRLVQSDVLRWLEKNRQDIYNEQSDRSKFDLIFVDPPTFSNSKRADDFDVQMDHVRLLDACADSLKADGMIIFSNNNRRFKLDPALAERFNIIDTSKKYLPEDFERNPRIHQSFELTLR